MKKMMAYIKLVEASSLKEKNSLHIDGEEREEGCMTLNYGEMKASTEMRVTGLNQRTETYWVGPMPINQ